MCCTGTRVLTGIYIYIPMIFCDQVVFLATSPLAIWVLTEASCFVCRERNKDTAYLFFLSNFKGHPWLLCKTQELEEMRGIIIEWNIENYIPLMGSFWCSINFLLLFHPLGCMHGCATCFNCLH
jgi:hypothetical protein